MAGLLKRKLWMLLYVKIWMLYLEDWQVIKPRIKE